MPLHEPIIGLPDYKIISAQGTSSVRVCAEFIGRVLCPICNSQRLRTKDVFWREIRNHSLGLSVSYLCIRVRKYLCRDCGKYFNQKLPGVQPYQRSTQLFREEVALKHHQGQAKSVVAKFLRIGAATVERWYQDWLATQSSERKNAHCPKVLGIDEKHFTRKKGYMTTLCDLKRHKVYDVMLGRSEKSLEGYLNKMPGKSNCRVVLMDMSETYRSIVKKHLPQALIVADRFHVVRLINHQTLKTWSLIHEDGRKNRGLLSLMRRHEDRLTPEQKLNLRRYLRSHPGLEAIYDFKQHLVKIILARVYTKDQARRLIPDFIKAIEMLKAGGFKPLETLGHTLENWQEEIVRMWRFSKTNSITEGLHNRMEEIMRRAYGFRNFENFKLRVKAFCG